MTQFVIYLLCFHDKNSSAEKQRTSLKAIIKRILRHLYAFYDTVHAK